MSERLSLKLQGRLSNNHAGVFAQSIIDYFPLLPIIEEPMLADKELLLLFELRVLMYHCIQHYLLRMLVCSMDGAYKGMLSKISIESTKEGQIRLANLLLEDVNLRQKQQLLEILRGVINVT